MHNRTDSTSKAQIFYFPWQAFLVCCFGLLAVNWLITQFLASRLVSLVNLGTPLWQTPWGLIYYPWDWIVWGWHYSGIAYPPLKNALNQAFLLAAIGSAVVGITTNILAQHQRQRSLNRESNSHGSAQFATFKEIKAIGLLEQEDGVTIGGYYQPKKKRLYYLRHNGPEHVMVFAPTRSGKGLSLILPTLLSWSHSILVYDIKGENWAITAGWRAKELGQAVYKFEPTATDGSSIRINPLQEIRLGTAKEISDTQNIATMIVDPEGRGLNDHWTKTSFSFLVGVILHVLYAEQNKTLNGIAEFLSNPKQTISDTLQVMLNTEHDREKKYGWRDNQGESTFTHPVVAASASEMLNRSENERSSVYSTTLSFLSLYRDPIVAHHTSQSDVSIRQLMDAEKPISLYLVVSPSDKDRLKPLIRLLLTQMIRLLTEKPINARQSINIETPGDKPKNKEPNSAQRLLLLIDEFPSLGKLEIFEEALAFMAGYGIQVYLITQDIMQLWQAYGRDESIFSNCHIRIAFAPNKLETAEMLSKMTGVATYSQTKATYSGKIHALSLSGLSLSQQALGRPLLTPDEIMRLPTAKRNAQGQMITPGDMLIFIAGLPPIYGKQTLYFLDPVFTKRAKIMPPLSNEISVERKDKARINHKINSMNTEGKTMQTLIDIQNPLDENETDKMQPTEIEPVSQKETENNSLITNQQQMNHFSPPKKVEITEQTHPEKPTIKTVLVLSQTETSSDWEQLC